MYAWITDCYEKEFRIKDIFIHQFTIKTEIYGYFFVNKINNINLIEDLKQIKWTKSVTYLLIWT